MVSLEPSLLCADFSQLGAEISRLDAAGVSSYHIDIMDGVFVPNFGLSLLDVAVVKRLSTKPFDAHLMVAAANLPYYLPKVLDSGANTIYIHAEIGSDVRPFLQSIKARGLKAGLAINPETSLEAAMPLLSAVDSLLIMRVNPGRAGQKPLAEVEPKIKAALAMPERHFSVKIDGGVDFEGAVALAKQHADALVLGGSSNLFNPQCDAKIVMQQLISAINR